MGRAGTEVGTRIEEIYGDRLEEPPGVLHVASAFADPSGQLRTLRIEPGAPVSATDGFVLALARARCDAIVTTGRILRDEPDVHHQLPEALSKWRRQRLGKIAQPISVVLTSRPQLDLAHPLLAGGSTIVVTNSRAARLLEQAVETAGAGDRVRVLGRDEPSLRDTIGCLQSEPGVVSICVEAGPSTAASLYEDPVLVDELMLSVYGGPRLPARLQGGSLPDSLSHRMELVSELVFEEESGPWSFRRLRRV